MFVVGQKYTLTKEPEWSTGGRKGQVVEVVQKEGYLAFKDNKNVTWPVNEKQIQ